MSEQVQPSPDWNMATLKWAGNMLDGTAAMGTIQVQYDGPGPFLDDDLETPLSIFKKAINVPITTKAVTIAGEARQVGYAEFKVPFSNDPDIQGSGGTYSFSENLNGGTGRKNVSFVADVDTPDGIIWLNKLPGAIPDPGEPLGVVYYADFVELEARVTAIELGGGGGGPGGVTDHGLLTGLTDDDHTQYHNNTRGDARYNTKAEITTLLLTKQNTGSYATTTQLTDGLATKQNAGSYATTTQLTDGLATKQNAGSYATTTQLTDGLEGKSNTGHNHDDRYYTETEVDDELALKQDVATIPIRVLLNGDPLPTVTVPTLIVRMPV